jgi:predicted esterase
MLSLSMKYILSIVFVSSFWYCASTIAADDESASLLSAFWSAATESAQQDATRQLLAAAGNVSNLYQQMKIGPDFAADVPRGYIEDVRLSADGTRFPYVVLIPETYDPQESYPVEFMLHGGVSRPAWEAGGGWWRRGYDSLQNPDLIMVVPAAWNDAFWWFENQAENLPALLREVKRQYNVDDNRVTLTGVSDGGTGAYFFAFKQHTHWAAFMPFIAHPAVLQNPASGGGYQLYFENLTAKPLYIVNGEEDPLYPASSVLPFIENLRKAEINHVFKEIAGGGHNTAWLPDENAQIEQFKLDNPRDPFPESVKWVTDTTERFNRNHWVQIDQLLEDGQPGMVTAERQGNVINVTAVYVTALTLLLNPEEVNFSQPIAIYINGELTNSSIVEQDAATLLKWAAIDLDKSMLVTAELNLQVPN